MAELVQLCIICNSTSSLRCSGCKQVHYCGREHQKQHWKSGHKDSCQQLNGAPSEGETSDKTSVANTTSTANTHAQQCQHCFREGMETTGVQCACGAWYCRQKCKDKHWRGEHKQLCEAAKKKGKTRTDSAVKKSLTASEALKRGTLQRQVSHNGKNPNRLNAWLPYGECPICNERFDHSGCHNVRSDTNCTELKLSCGHSVCHRCLHGMRTKMEAGVNPCCPMCRAEIPPSPDELLEMGKECHRERHDPTQRSRAGIFLTRALEEAPGLGEAWWRLITVGGGVVGGVEYSPADCCARTLHMSHTTRMSMERRADEDRHQRDNHMHSNAWFHFGLQGGGAMEGQAYSQAECFIRSLELCSLVPEVWLSLGIHGGGTVCGQCYLGADCMVQELERLELIYCDNPYCNKNHALDHDAPVINPVIRSPSKAIAWIRLAEHGGGLVSGHYHSPEDCIHKSRQMCTDPDWYNMVAADADLPGAIIGGQLYSSSDCYIRCIEISDTVVSPDSHTKAPQAWCNLGIEGGGKVANKVYSSAECYIQSLELHPDANTAANAWCNLGMNGGGTVDGVDVAPTDCHIRALELHSDESVAMYMAWYKLARAGGGTVDGENYTPAECNLEGERLDPKYKGKTC